MEVEFIECSNCMANGCKRCKGTGLVEVRLDRSRRIDDLLTQYASEDDLYS